MTLNYTEIDSKMNADSEIDSENDSEIDSESLSDVDTEFRLCRNRECKISFVKFCKCESCFCEKPLNECICDDKIKEWKKKNKKRFLVWFPKKKTHQRQKNKKTFH